MLVTSKISKSNKQAFYFFIIRKTIGKFYLTIIQVLVSNNVQHTM